jgi:hypothetical protein
MLTALPVLYFMFDPTYLTSGTNAAFTRMSVGLLCYFILELLSERGESIKLHVQKQNITETPV